MNAPDPDDFVRHDINSEIKLSVKRDARMTGAMEFTINKEDHTLGNLLRAELLRDEDVQFAGYKIPHPLEPRLIIKVQSKSEPFHHFMYAMNRSITEVQLIGKAFADELQKFRSNNAVGF